MLRTVLATRYVTPLREGGSLPAIVEASDDGLYVLKFRGAGQGPLALVAELVAGEIGRALGIRVPELVKIEIDENMGRTEPDAEIRELIGRSRGLNLALDYLPGSITYDPAAREQPTASVASDAVWFDAFVTNVDRTARNPNLLWWHRTLYFIDHGAALYFHHDWRNLEKASMSKFPAIRDHVLLPTAAGLEEADRRARSALNNDVFEQILEAVPDAWLIPDGEAADPADRRRGYVEFLSRRLNASSVFVEEALRARALHV